MSCTASQLWLASAGGSLFVANFFLTIFSLLSFSLGLFVRFDLLPSLTNAVRQLRIVSILLSLTLCCVNLSLSTYRSADHYYHEIVDYGMRHSDDEVIINFLRDHWTYHSRAGYVLSRSADLNGPMIGLFTVWAGVSIVDLVRWVREKIVESEGGLT
jgi:hypothetical protein